MGKRLRNHYMFTDAPPAAATEATPADAPTPHQSANVFTVLKRSNTSKRVKTLTNRKGHEQTSDASGTPQPLVQVLAVGLAHLLVPEEAVLAVAAEVAVALVVAIDVNEAVALLDLAGGEGN